MPSTIFFLFYILFIVLFIGAILFYRHRRSSYSQLYGEGIRNENKGHYNLAIQNYEEALKEIKGPRINNKLGSKISQRLKILRATIDYEKNFQTGIKA